MAKKTKSVWPALEAKFVELEDAVARCKFTKARRLSGTISMNITIAFDLSVEEKAMFRARLSELQAHIPARAPRMPTKRQRDASFKQRMMTASKSDFYTAK